MEPALPLLPGAGRVRRRGLRANACSRRATPGRCHSRCSTTSSARPTPNRTAIDAMRSLLVLEDDARAARRCRAAPRARGLRLRRDRRRRGVGAPKPRRCYGAMGFAHVGPHRTKPVQLWQHGEISDRPQPRRGDEEPEVVAVAVESADPERSARGREALLAPVLDRLRKPGRGRPVGDRGADGTSVFFCRTAATGRAGSTTSSTVGRRARRRARRRCRSTGSTTSRSRTRSRPSTKPGSSTARCSICDPASQRGARRAPRARAQPRRRQRGPAGAHRPQRARAGRHAARPGRAPTRRLRTATTPSRRPRAMRERRGAASCAIPDNYYEDLDARFDARSPSGWTPCASWASCTTATPEASSCTSTAAHVGGRLFFEVLERRGAYDGYGAANSPVRMAAQRTAMVPVA